METFIGESDRFKGITVDSQKEPCELEVFTKKLHDSLEKWRDEGRRCIWFKVDIKDATWVPLLANESFNFHHSRGDFVMMYRWLPTDSPCNLPPACHTNLGVGAIVFNERNQLLVVTEHHYEKPHWKLPGGYVERSEDLKDAAIREVKEETGIDATFESLITFRHIHNMMFDNSDIYTIVKLKATTEQIHKSDIEIKACQWMDVDEFLNHSQVIDFNKQIVRQSLEWDSRKLKLSLKKITENTPRAYTAVQLEDF